MSQETNAGFNAPGFSVGSEGPLVGVPMTCATRCGSGMPVSCGLIVPTPRLASVVVGVGHIAGDPQSAIALIARLDGGFSRFSVRTAYSYVPLAWFTSEHAGVGHIAGIACAIDRRH